MNFFFEKIPSILVIELWTLKVGFQHLLINNNSSQDGLKILWACRFLGKNLAFKDPTSLKFHNQTAINMYYLKYWTLVDSLLRRPSNSKLGSSLLRKITSTSTSSLFGFKKILVGEYLQFEKDILKSNWL